MLVDHCFEILLEFPKYHIGIELQHIFFLCSDNTRSSHFDYILGDNKYS